MSLVRQQQDPKSVKGFSINEEEEACVESGNITHKGQRMSKNMAELENGRKSFLLEERLMLPTWTTPANVELQHCNFKEQ